MAYIQDFISKNNPRDVSLNTHFQKSAFLFIAVVFFAGFLNGCGGSSNNGAGAGLTTASNGKLALIFTDAPTDDFSQVNVTIKEAALVSESDDSIILFQGSRRINLLALQEVEALFTVRAELPVGTYHKIRLMVEAPEFVKKDGTIISSSEIQLVANGKIDLLSQQGFSITPEETLVLRIDMDAKKSIHIHQTGNFKYKFRPVVFVDALHDIKERILSVSGTIESIDTANQSFLLKREDHDAEQGSNDKDLDHGTDSLRVFVSEGTVLADVSGDVLNFEVLKVGQKLQVHGFLKVIQEGPDSFSLLAKLIEIGESFHLEGEITVGLKDGTFTFMPEAGQGFTEAVIVEVKTETLILKQGHVIAITDADLSEGRTIILNFFRQIAL